MFITRFSQFLVMCDLKHILHLCRRLSYSYTKANCRIIEGRNTVADEEHEVRTQTSQIGDTQVEKQSVSHRSGDESVMKVEKVVYLIYGILAGLLAVRFVLSLLGANRSNAFADFIYTMTGPMVSPFRGLFSIDTTYGVSRFDIESLMAIIVFGLIAWIISKALDISKKNSTEI